MGSRTVSGPVLAAEDAWLKLSCLGVEPPHDTEVSVQVGHIPTLALCITPEHGRLARWWTGQFHALAMGSKTHQFCLFGLTAYRRSW